MTCNDNAGCGFMVCGWRVARCEDGPRRIIPAACLGVAIIRSVEGGQNSFAQVDDGAADVDRLFLTRTEFASIHNPVCPGHQ